MLLDFSVSSFLFICNVGLIPLNFKTGIIFSLFFFLEGVGGAEPPLATNRCKTPTYILKILKLLQEFGISDTSSGLRDVLGKAEAAVVTKAGTQGGGVATCRQLLAAGHSGACQVALA